MKKRLSLILVLTMLLSVLSIAAYADEPATGDEQVKVSIYSEDFEDNAEGAYSDWTKLTGASTKIPAWVIGENVTYTVESNNGGKRLVIANNEALVDGNTFNKNSYAQVVPASVMDQYKTNDYFIEYDLTFLTNKSGFAYAGAGMIANFNGDVDNFTMPLFRACGRGNGWVVKDASFFTTDSDTGVMLSNNAWLNTVTGGDATKDGAYKFSETLTDGDGNLGGQIGCTLSVRIKMTPTTVDVYAKYGDGEYVRISGTDGNTAYKAVAANTAGVGITVWPGVSVAVDNVNVYKVGSIRDNCTHEYDNDCDTDCNICKTERTIEHKYSETLSSNENVHWYECSVCKTKKDIAAHKYENGKCACGAEDKVAETTAPVTEAADVADSGAETSQDEDGGCGGSIGVGALALIVPAMAAIAVSGKRRKK